MPRVRHAAGILVGLPGRRARPRDRTRLGPHNRGEPPVHRAHRRGTRHAGPAADPPGDTEALQVSADENLHDYFEITTDGGARPGFHLRPSRRIRYTLTVREIESIRLSSSGDASAPALRADRFEVRLGSSGDLSVDAIQADAVDVRLGSSGDLSVGAVQADAVDVRLGSSGDLAVDDLRTGSLAVRISSSGDVRIGAGEVDSLDLTINSSGDYDGESVRSTRATVALSSSGDARLWAEESLGAKLTSSGSVSYRGDPEVVKSVNSSGRVRPIR